MALLSLAIFVGLLCRLGTAADTQLDHSTRDKIDPFFVLHPVNAVDIALEESTEEEHEEEEEGESDAAAVARFTCSLGVIVVVASLVIKEMQSRRDHFAATNPITYQMVEATIEECVACGAIAMCFIVLRENAFIDVLATIASLPGIRLGEYEVTEAVERIDAVIFWTFFYYFMVIIICVCFVNFKLKEWKAEEDHAQHCRDGDTTYRRLRYSFFNPLVPRCGVRVVSECSAFDVANLDFAQYLEHATAHCICEVINLPKVVILAPMLGLVASVAVFDVLGIVKGRALTRADLLVAIGFSWALLISAVLLRLDLRRIYKKVVPATKKGHAPFMEGVAGHLSRSKTNDAMRRLGTPMDKELTMSKERSGRSSRAMSKDRSERAVSKEPTFASSVTRVLSEVPGLEDLSENEKEKARWTAKILSPARHFFRQGSSKQLAMEEGEEEEEERNKLAINVKELHGQLFWFGSWGTRHTGPWVLRTCIQFVLFCMCVLASITHKMFPVVLLHQNRILQLLFWLPFPVILALVLTSLPELVLATKLELLADERIVNEVVEQTKTHRFVPFVGTHTGRRLVQQMKYEACMEKFRIMPRGELEEFVLGAQDSEAYEALPEVEKALLEVIFQHHDRDHSGAIDGSELQACLIEEGFSAKTAERVAVDWMDLYDVDHSGYLSFEEFKMLHTILLHDIKHAHVTPADCVSMCKRLDKNKNGKLNSEELSEAFKEWVGARLHPNDIRSIFGNIGPESHAPDEMVEEVDVQHVAEWIYRLYEMTRVMEKSQEAMMKPRTSEAEEHGTRSTGMQSHGPRVSFLMESPRR